MPPAKVERRPDPVSEVCTMRVKLAVLGHACWTVRRRMGGGGGCFDTPSVFVGGRGCCGLLGTGETVNDGLDDLGEKLRTRNDVSVP